MLKTFLLKAGKKLKQLTGSDKKKPAPVTDQQEQQAVIANKNRAATGQTADQGKYRRTRPLNKKKRRKKKPRWTVAKFPVDPVEGKCRFHDFALPAGLMHGIADLDFKYCTPIQEKALPDAMAGKDIIGRAGTGTGKSAVFLIALFSRLLAENKEQDRIRREEQKKNRKTGDATDQEAAQDKAGKKNHNKQGKKYFRKPGCPRALIIAPTRELVMQIAKDGQALAKYTQLRIVAVYGGTDYRKQEQQLRERPVDVMVATPGRLLDYASKRVVNLGQAAIMVIDEADRMLDMGFIPDVRRIIYKTPAREKRQPMLFSATVTEDVKHLASQWCVKPISIESEPEQVAVDTVEQIIYTTTTDEKYNVLYNLITTREHERILVFTNMKSEARRLNDRLRRNSINATLLTGDVPQQKRMARLESFRAGRVKVMIATDVAGRGIHIDGISHVVNYTLPYEPEDYVHRIGRTGRAGQNGIAISFACEEGAFYLPDIEEFINKPLVCVQPEEDLLVKPPKGSKKSSGSHGHKKPYRKRRR
jgi:ATP-dependent RNA helicase RhlB